MFVVDACSFQMVKKDGKKKKKKKKRKHLRVSDMHAGTIQFSRCFQCGTNKTLFLTGSTHALERARDTQHDRGSGEAIDSGPETEPSQASQEDATMAKEVTLGNMEDENGVSIWA